MIAQLRATVFVFLQYLLPRHGVTRLIHAMARIRSTRVKDFLITRFVRHYDVDTDEVKLAIPGDFSTFNDFFIRELNAAARPIDAARHSIVSPVDGTVSAAGALRGNSILQAKGRDYSVQDLLATDMEEAAAYEDGRFATIYLAPYNYHRIHAPLAGELVAARYVPGDLFSVNGATVSRVNGLFRRNERLVMHFKTAHGPAVVILVGALNVGSISTPWSGESRPRKTGVVQVINLSTHPTTVAKGDLLGWFNMGSTVILLLPGAVASWHDNLEPGATLRMGEAIGAYGNGAQ